MKAARGCWTCKRRKIGCDRSIPNCNNCTRTQRACGGYGTRLTWPDEGRSRRGDFNVCYGTVVASTDSRFESLEHKFLNFTCKDFALEQDHLTWHHLMHSPSPQPKPSLSLHLPIVGEHAILLAYYEQIIAPMCSTTRAQNGFRSHILPLVLSCRDASTSALCSSLLAISAHHRKKEGAALAYKIGAVKGLYESLAPLSNEGSVRTAQVQLATSMMLCMYSVFDEQEAQFHLHLDGAKKILSNMHWRECPVPEFLVEWILYYDTLSGFAQPSPNRDSQLSVISYPDMLQFDENLIIGLIGCSVEVFNCINSINHIRTVKLQSGAVPDPVSNFQRRVALEQRLQNLRQTLSPDEISNSTVEQIRNSLATADLYRLASLLYLQRIVPTIGDELRRADYLRRIFVALGTLQVATSPWPVFITACEVRAEQERACILEVLYQMEKVRNVGNVSVMRGIIETIWKQQDLQDIPDKPEPMQWWLRIQSSVPVPWFV